MKRVLISSYCLLHSTAYSLAFLPPAPTFQVLTSPRKAPNIIASSDDGNNFMNDKDVNRFTKITSVNRSKIIIDETLIHNIPRRTFLNLLTTAAIILPHPSYAIQPQTPVENPFHSTATGREEYTNSIVASRDTNISPREVYDTISSEYLRNVLDTVEKEGGVARALDVGAGAGVSTEVLYRLGYHQIDAIDWSGTAWQKYVIDDPSGYCPSTVHFYELDDERYLDSWRSKYKNNSQEGLFDVIVFNFAVNEAKAKLFARELLNKNHGVVLAPINTMNDYWLKQNYKVMNSDGDILWSTADVGAWSVQFQPDVTQDTCSGVWCAPFNGFQKKK